ncbi:MAG TPA: DUF6089 family protein [Chitinophagaceae bacterium]|nr:DUF6089 family protein [Chitinophagaceae bacterium]
MKRSLLCACLLLAAAGGFGQDWHIGVFGGISSYSGDLSDKFIQGHQQSRGAVGVTLNYDYSEHLSFRAGYTHAGVSANDKFSTNAEHLKRNLSFFSALDEFSLIGEYYPISLRDQRYSPYFFAGLAVFHFNPYTYDTTGRKYYLKPLSTEGEGLPQYPGVKPYNLTQLAIPFGAGIKFVLSDRVRLGLEFGVRKLFTDYLDDVSGNYADPADLLAARGPKAVELSYRGGEVPGGDPTYPDKGKQRGSAKKDWYYIGGLHLTYSLGTGGGGGGLNLFRSLRGTGCPANPQ